MRLYLQDNDKCTGCGACIAVCPMRCITMNENSEGFLYPIIDHEVCVDCGKCDDVCKKKDISDKFDGYSFAAWTKNNEIRSKSSSGGVFYEIASTFINSGGIVYGAGYDTDYSVKHIRIDKVEDLKRIIGAKYVQSASSESLSEVLEDLRKGNNILYSGTPCQIRAAKMMTMNFPDKILGISVICHGVPSPMVWKKYLMLKKGQYSEDDIVALSFRDKTFGWNDFSMKIEFSNNVYLEEYEHDLYMQGFLANLYLRKSCYNCDFKGKQDFSDIILGDFWGIENEMTGIDSGRGCSCVIINSQKGEDVWSKIKEKLFYAEVEYEQIIRENAALEESVQENQRRKHFFDQLANNGIIEEVIKSNLYVGDITDNFRRDYQYQIIYRYFESKLRGLNIYDLFIKRNMKRIVLYGVTDILRLILTDMKHFKEIEVYLADRNSEYYKKEFSDYEVFRKEDLADKGRKAEIDAVIVCNPLRENQIMRELHECGVRDNLIYSVIPFITSMGL